MNIKTVLKTISYLTLIISGFMVFPAGIALYNHEYLEFKCFLISIAIIVTCSLFQIFIFRKSKRKNLSARDGFLFVTLSWTIASAFGALPYYLSHAIPSYTDAFFETISGFSTTGASILTSIETLPRSILFWRSLTHWLGGMGIVVLTVAILPLLGIGGLQLLKAEAPGPTVDKISPRIAETAKKLWLLYLGMTLLETILLMFGGMDLFDALTHTFGTVATGGFSPKNNSIAFYDSPYLQWVIIIFMILAGINFNLHYRFVTGHLKTAFKDSEFKTYLLIIGVATTIIAINLYNHTYDSASQSIRYAAFQVATIITTTGYGLADYEQWPFISQMLIFALMFVGGCSGSTGGGIKVIRLVTLFKQAFNEMKYLIHPRGIFTLKISGSTVKKDVVYAIAGFFFLYILFVLGVTFCVATSGQDLLTAFTTALSAVGNIGPGFGKIGPTENYSFYPNYVKWVLSFAMLTGRLELYTVLVIFTPTFWKR